MRVRWALEEVGQAYEVHLLSFAEMKQQAHLARHPFGQIPTWQEGELTLFESGAIVLHIAEGHAGLLPQDAAGRARAVTWMFAAASTLEPVNMERETAWFTERDKPWYAEHMGAIEERIRHRLGQFSARLGAADRLDGAFSAGDLMVAGVLWRLQPTGLLDGFANLSAYVARGAARPAFQRALAAQLAVFQALQPAG